MDTWSYHSGYYNKFSVIQNTSSEIDQPEHVSQKLFLHQRKAVQQLATLERSHLIQPDPSLVGGASIEFDTNIGIYADKVGAGKTLVMTSLVSTNYDVKQVTRRVINASQSFAAYSIKNETCLPVDLIIVPHSLITQWKNTLHLVKELNVKVVNNKKTLQEYELLSPLSVDVVLISNTMFKKTTQPYRVVWRRVIIDEPQMIALPSEPVLKASFTWLVCATPYQLLYSNRQYLRRLVKTIPYRNRILGPYRESNLSSLIVIKNHDSIVDESIRLPPYKEVTVWCKEPAYMRAIRENIPKHALERLQANDVEGALNELNCSAASSSNIVDSLIKSYKDKVHNETLEIERLRQVRNITSTERESRIKIHQDKVNDYTKKIESIVARVADSKEQMCPICLDTINEPKAITNCCQNSFCLECMLMALSTKHDKRCPACRTPHCDRELHVQVSDLPKPPPSKTKENDKKTKAGALLDILQNLTPESRVLVFSEYSGTFNNAAYNLRERGIKYAELKGSMHVQDHTIEAYRNGDVQILLLNARHIGAGVNLQMTTDLVMYHKFREKDLQRQVIGRAQRLGRTSPLTVTYLKYSDE